MNPCNPLRSTIDTFENTLMTTLTNPTTAQPVSSEAARQLCKHLYQWCGVHLDDTKTYLLKNRLRSLMQKWQVSDFGDLVQLSQGKDGMAVRDRIVDALTTHETLFFRDRSPFDALAQHIVPEARNQTNVNQPGLKIWSAACSSGQEPYSIAIKLIETIPEIDQWSLSILASDVSKGTVDQARKGVYQEHELSRGISSIQKSKFFAPQDKHWKLTDRVRKMVTFQVGNLNSPSQPTGPFDVIFCRNVLIYFTPEDANRILRVIASRLAPSGRLFVGCSEVLRDVSDFLVAETVGQATCYRRVN